MENKYSLLRVVLLMLFGSRFGLKRDFISLSEDLQRDVIESHIENIVVNLFFVIIAILITGVFLPLTLQLTIKIMMFTISILFAITIGNLLEITSFLNQFDTEDRMKRQELRQIERAGIIEKR